MITVKPLLLQDGKYAQRSKQKPPMPATAAKSSTAATLRLERKEGSRFGSEKCTAVAANAASVYIADT